MLRAEVSGKDTRHLDAFLDDGGNLVLEGQDLGPATSIVSADGEYEWSRRVSRSDLPALVEALGGQPGDDVLEVLSMRATGSGSYELERLLREGVVPSVVSVY